MGAHLNETLYQLGHGGCQDPTIAFFSNQAFESVSTYMGLVKQLTDSLMELPETIDELSNRVDRDDWQAFWLPLLPVMLVTFICVCITFETLTVYFAGSSKWAFKLDRCLRYAGPMYILMLLFVPVLGMASMRMP